MKKIFILFFQIVLIGCYFNSVHGQTSEEDMKRIKITSDSVVLELTKKLELKEGQQIEIGSILLPAMITEFILNKQIKLIVNQLEEKIKETNNEASTRIDALLDEEQLKILKTERKNPTDTKFD